MYRNMLNVEAKTGLIELKVYFMTRIYFYETFRTMLKNLDFKTTGFYSGINEFV